MHQLKVKEAKTWWEKSVGLIGVKKPYALIFKTRFGIHTLGLKFAIDVLILDQNNFVVSFRENLKPNQCFFWNPKYCQVLELPPGTIKELAIKLKDQIKFDVTP